MLLVLTLIPYPCRGRDAAVNDHTKPTSIRRDAAVTDLTKPTCIRRNAAGTVHTKPTSIGRDAAGTDPTKPQQRERCCMLVQTIPNLKEG